MNRGHWIFDSFELADLAATAAERVVLSAAAAHLENAGPSATAEQIDVATTLRIKANGLFNIAMKAWIKLSPVQKQAKGM